MIAALRRTQSGASGSPKESLTQTVYPEPRATAAIVQLEAVHEDGLPAMVHLLRLNGIEPTLFLNARIRENRAGLKHRFPELKERTRFVTIEGRPGWRRLRRRIEALDPDLLVMNTFQNAGPVAWASRWERPILGVVHNTSLVEQSDLAKEMVADGRAGVLTLAPHVTAHLMSIDPVLYGGAASITYTFPNPPRVKPVRSQRRTIAVPGSVNLRSRDYQQVLDALPVINEVVDPASYRIDIVGGGADRPVLEKKVVEAGLSDQFHFVDLNDQGFVDGGPYYGHLLGADFTLPLVPARSPSFRTQKITSAIPASIGVGVPPIIDRWTAVVYDVPAVAFVGPKIGEGLARALAMGADELEALRADVLAHKERELARSADEMAYALTSLGLGA